MSGAFTSFLRQQDLVLLDGGLATELERRGADLRDPLWSARVLLEAPDLLRQVHLDYFRAGANVATTASYQASFPGLEARGLDRTQAAAVMQRSVALAAEARDQFMRENPTASRPWVAASIGCYGAFLHDGSEYRGAYGLTQRQLLDWHRPRLETLIASGPDLLALETIPCLVEAEALVRLLEEYPTAPAWLSCSCRDGRHLCGGEPFAAAVALAAASPNIVAVGVNCTAPGFVADLLEAGQGSVKPLLAYPNSGEAWEGLEKKWTSAGRPFDWTEGAKAWRRAGARLIGGCCRTTPATIANLHHFFVTGS